MVLVVINSTDWDTDNAEMELTKTLTLDFRLS